MLFKRIQLWFTLLFDLLYVFMQLLYGAWKLFALDQPMVSIFGGSRLKLDDPYALQASELAQRFTNHNISVVTGGGPGIMEAASCGAVKLKNGNARSIGIGVRNLQEKRNPCVQEYFELNYFFARKWLLTHYSKAFIVFPGGFGTLDELAEVLSLIQTKQLLRVPIILIGVKYWSYFMMWIEQEVLKHNLITSEDLNLFVLTDNLDEAFALVFDICCKKEK